MRIWATFLALFVLQMACNGAVYTSDGSYADTDAKNALTVDGDELVLPSGSFRWTGNQLVITNAIYFHGAGSNQTVVVNGTANGIKIQPHNNKVSRIGNFNLDGEHTNSAAMLWLRGFVDVSSPNGSAIYVDGMIFTNDTQGLDCIVADDVLGCINMCIFTNYNAGIQVQNGRWGNNTDGYGDGAWADDDYFGTTNALYPESCQFGGRGFQIGAIDAIKGAHYVFRHNVVSGDILVAHGTESGGRFRSVRAGEIYANTFTASSDFQNEIRGGVWMVYSNNCHHFPQMINFKEFRDNVNCPAGLGSFPPWGFADGTGTYDSNFSAVCQIPLDKVGNGKGILLSGTTPSPTGYPSQIFDICYGWANTNDGVAINIGRGCSTTLLINGRDYTNVTSAPVGYTALVFPHPLVTAFSTDPAITVQPQNQTVTIGQTATFTITASGNSTLHYAWTFNGSAVGTDSSTYARVNCQLADSGGSVVCTVTDSGPNSPQQSSTVTLTVNPNVYPSQIGAAKIGTVKF